MGICVINLWSSFVTPSVLYGCSSWTLTKEQEMQLKRVQRRMLRWMVCIKRKPEEDWVSYVKRSTYASEEIACKYGCKPWLQLYMHRKWEFAGKCARRTDHRWSKRLLDWKPWFRSWPHRDVGHPHKRWEDTFLNKVGEAWVDAAQDESFWQI